MNMLRHKMTPLYKRCKARIDDLAKHYEARIDDLAKYYKTRIDDLGSCKVLQDTNRRSRILRVSEPATKLSAPRHRPAYK